MVRTVTKTLVSMDPSRPTGDSFSLAAGTYLPTLCFEILARALPSILTVPDERQQKESSHEDRYSSSLRNHVGGHLHGRVVRAFSIRHPLVLADMASAQSTSARNGTAALASQKGLTTAAPIADTLGPTGSIRQRRAINLMTAKQIGIRILESVV